MFAWFWLSKFVLSTGFNDIFFVCNLEFTPDWHFQYIEFETEAAK